MASPSSGKRMYDVVLWGCTGFTGRLVAEYFAKSISARYPTLRWALAGRNGDRLADVKEAAREQSGGAASPDVLVGDSTDQGSVDAIVGTTRVMVGLAGPFIKYGTPVVDACVRLGTNYVDINGETPWVRSLIDKYDASCRASGTRIVPGCGFDSIPSDLGALFTVNQLRRLNGGASPARRVTAHVKVRGAWSGGTIATGITLEQKGAEVMKQLDDVFLLGGATPDGYREEDADIKRAIFSEDLQRWCGPFFMAHINTRVVRRSAAYLGWGPSFNYQEILVTKDEAQAQKLARGTAPLEKRIELVERGALPSPGQGPDAATRAQSFFHVTLVGESEAGDKVATTLSGGDPGYGETSKMVAESAVYLARTGGAAGAGGGVMTPAMALGEGLIAELNAQGIAFAVDTDLTAQLKRSKL
eukprot:UC1_evm2s1589